MLQPPRKGSGCLVSAFLPSVWAVTRAASCHRLQSRPAWLSPPLLAASPLVTATPSVVGAKPPGWLGAAPASPATLSLLALLSRPVAARLGLLLRRSRPPLLHLSALLPFLFFELLDGLKVLLVPLVLNCSRSTAGHPLEALPERMRCIWLRLSIALPPCGAGLGRCRRLAP